MQPRRGHCHQHVALAHPVWAEHRIRFDDADTRPGQVVLVFAEDSRMLGSLPADEGAASPTAPLGDPTHDLGDPLRDEPAAGQVVEQEQRLCPAHDQVVGDHRNEVDPDRVVAAESLGDQQLGPHAVRGRGKQRAPPPRQIHGEQARKAAEPADNLGPGCHGDLGAQQLHRPLARLDVHTGGAVGHTPPRAGGNFRGGHG